ncbi:hypothetical protein E6C27_scaffold270G001610 [Cucumis melo var. makuwa]|uniref:Uncharacterized protein n=2 Tax=Cucumis melo TaxID=3656 RepID=A0A5A7T7V1_CUCMM|nr:hypothetical protein E6C27_scaffold270G001610 [Cucumis melo var. makuwa]
MWDFDRITDSVCDPFTPIEDEIKNLEDVSLVPVGSPRKEVLEKVVDDPLLKGKGITSKIASETHPPSPPKETSKQHDTAKESDDKDEYFKFIENNFGKPMRDGFEDMFQCQANFQESQLRSQK